MNITDLKNYIKNNPEKTVKEIAAHFGVTHECIRLCIKKHNIEYIKKHNCIKQKN